MAARSEWGSLVSDFTKEIHELVATERDKLAVIALTAVVEESPVDQGTFVLNNIVSIGSPDFTSDETRKSSLGSLFTDDYDARAEVAKGEALSQGKRKISKRKRIFTEIYIQNNVSYVDEVEETGWYYKDAYETYKKAADYLERHIDN